MPAVRPDAARGLSKHTLRLRLGDTTLLDAAYPDIGHNVVIRNLVAAHVEALQAAKAEAHPAPELPFLEVPEDVRHSDA